MASRRVRGLLCAALVFAAHAWRGRPWAAACACCADGRAGPRRLRLSGSEVGDRKLTRARVAASPPASVLGSGMPYAAGNVALSGAPSPAAGVRARPWPPSHPRHWLPSGHGGSPGRTGRRGCWRRCSGRQLALSAACSAASSPRPGTLSCGSRLALPAQRSAPWACWRRDRRGPPGARDGRAHVVHPGRRPALGRARVARAGAVAAGARRRRAARRSAGAAAPRTGRSRRARRSPARTRSRRSRRTPRRRPRRPARAAGTGGRRARARPRWPVRASPEVPQDM